MRVATASNKVGEREIGDEQHTLEAEWTIVMRKTRGEPSNCVVSSSASWEEIG